MGTKEKIWNQVDNCEEYKYSYARKAYLENSSIIYQVLLNIIKNIYKNVSLMYVYRYGNLLYSSYRAKGKNGIIYIIMTTELDQLEIYCDDYDQQCNSIKKYSKVLTDVLIFDKRNLDKYYRELQMVK